MNDDSDDKDQKHLPWTEGLPTKPDVDLLFKTWPELKVGDRLDYEVVEQLLGNARDTARFRTVTNQWRKRWLERGIVIECDTGKAFYVPAVDVVAGNTYPVLLSVGRRLRKQRVKLSVQKPETDAQREDLEHKGRMIYAVERADKKARMNILPSSKASEMPRIQPPAGKAEPQEQPPGSNSAQHSTGQRHP